jgi:hypothetical protein
VALGHGDQLAWIEAAAGGLMDHGGGGGLVSIVGGGGDRQLQPGAARRPGRCRRSLPVAVAGWRLDRQMAACASAQVRAPGITSEGRQDRARATMACARAW